MKAPIKEFRLQKYPDGSITQWFGENKELYSRIDLNGHNGIDIVAPHGTPMYAVEDGVVLDVKDDPGGYGRHVRFLYCDREWTYGHCDTILVKVGDTIKEGQQIATMGNTGFVVSGATPYWKHNPYAGTHLHLGLRRVKRSASGWSYPESKIKLKVLNYDNGLKGSVDPRPLLEKVSDDFAIIEKQLTLVSLLTRLVELYKQLAIIKNENRS